MKSPHGLLALVVVAWSLESPALAQPSGLQDSGVVSGAGTAKIERPPTIMRMQIELSGKGKSVRDALAGLKDRREAAIAQLVKLGAPKDSIKVAEPTIAAAANDQQRQMQMMIRQRMAGRKKSNKPETKPTITLTSTLTVEWPLPAGNAEELLTTAHELREKVQQADLAGLKEAAKLSPEEEELAEEAVEVQSYGGEEAAKPGEPRFVFVARISDEEYAKLAAQAFAKARQKATALAAAAGARLGPLQRLDGQDGGASSYQEQYYMQMGYGYSTTQLQAEAGSDAHEAVGNEPGKVTYQVTVSAAFALQP